MIKKKIDHWKSEKFVPFSAQTFSANFYALSKMWYRISSINVVIGIIKKRIPTIKSCFYQDILIKPQEELLFRIIKDGELGLFLFE